MKLELDFYGIDSLLRAYDDVMGELPGRVLFGRCAKGIKILNSKRGVVVTDQTGRIVIDLTIAFQFQCIFRLPVIQLFVSRYIHVRILLKSYVPTTPRSERCAQFDISPRRCWQLRRSRPRRLLFDRLGAVRSRRHSHECSPHQLGVLCPP